MTTDEIIEMAEKAGIIFGYPAYQDRIEIFAKLVEERTAAKERADEREACVNVIETHRIPVGNSAAGEMACEWTYDALKEIRTAIRARAQADGGEA